MRAGTRAHECVCVCVHTHARAHTHTHRAWPGACPMFPVASLPVSRKTKASSPLVWGLLQRREEAWLWAISALSSLDPKCFGLEPGTEAFPCRVSLPVTVTSRLPLSPFIYGRFVWQVDGPPLPSKSPSISRPSFLTSGGNDESHRKSLLCVQTEPARGEAAKTEAKQSTCARAPPNIIRAARVCTAHRPIPETHSLHAGLPRIPSALSGRKGTGRSGLSLSLSMSPPPSLSSSHPQLHAPHKSCKTNGQEALPPLSPQAFRPRPPPLLFTSLSSSFFLILYTASWYLILVLSWLMS